MLNTPHKKSSLKQQASKFFTSVALTGGMLLFVLKPGVAKSNTELKAELAETLKKHSVNERKIVEPKEAKKAAKFEAMPNDTIDALQFIKDKVGKYYPELTQHVDSLLKSFWDQEHKDTVNYLLQQHIFKNIHDEQKQVASIIYCLENFAFKGNKKINKIFTKKYDIGTIVDDSEYGYLFNFSNGYNKRFKGYFMKLQTTIEEMKKKNEEMKKNNEEMKKKNEEMKKNNEEMKKKNEEMKKNIAKLDEEIAKQKKEIEGIINTFTIHDVKTNQQVKQLILNIEELYIYAGYEIYPHLAELIKAAKE